MAAVRGSSLVQAGGAVLDGQGVPASNGSLVRVQNAGRPSRAVFVSEDRGSGIIISSGGSGGGGGGTGMVSHDLNGVWHTGTLPWSKLSSNAVGEVLGASIAKMDSSIGGRDHDLLTNRNDLADPSKAHPQYALKSHTFESGTALDILGDAAQAGHNKYDLRGTNIRFSVRVQNQGGLEVSSLNDLRMTVPGTINAETLNNRDFAGSGHTHQVGAQDHSTSTAPSPAVVGELMKTTATGGFRFGTDKQFMDIDPTIGGVSLGRMPALSKTLLHLEATGPRQDTLVIQQWGTSAIRYQEDDMLRLVDYTGDLDGGSLIRVLNNGELRSAGDLGYTSGLRGWAIAPWGDAEFNNVTVRGSLYASVFVVDEKHAVGGEIVVTTASKLVRNVNVGSVQSDFLVQYRGLGRSAHNTEQLEANWWTSAIGTVQVNNAGGRAKNAAGLRVWIPVEDPASGAFKLFDVDDLLAIQTYSDSGPVIINALWLKVTKPTSGSFYRSETDDDGNHTNYAYYCEVMSGYTGIIPGGAAVVKFGTPGTGLIRIKSDRDSYPNDDADIDDHLKNTQHTPYMEVFETGTDPWKNGHNSNLRLGRMSGLQIPAPPGGDRYRETEFGMAISDRHFNGGSREKLFIGTNKRLYLQNIDLIMNDGTHRTVSLSGSTGRLMLGSNIDTVAGRFLDANPGASTPYLRIGNYAGGGQGVQYQGNALTVRGNIIVQRTSGWGSVAAGIDDAKSTADGAQTAADGAQTAADAVDTKVNELLNRTAAWDRAVARVAGSVVSEVNRIKLHALTIHLMNGEKIGVEAENFSIPKKGVTYFLSASYSPGATVSADMSDAPGDKSVIFGVVEQAVGAEYPYIRLLPGETIITGDSITTGSINASLITTGRLDAKKVAIDNLAVGDLDGDISDSFSFKNFSSAERYIAGAIVVHDGSLWRARVAISGGPFAESQWEFFGYKPDKTLVSVTGDIHAHDTQDRLVMSGVKVWVEDDGKVSPISLGPNAPAPTTIMKSFDTNNDGVVYFFVRDNVTLYDSLGVSDTPIQPATPPRRIYFATLSRVGNKYEVKLFGQGATRIVGDTIVTGTIGANKLNVTELSAVTSTMGELIIREARTPVAGDFMGVRSKPLNRPADYGIILGLSTLSKTATSPRLLGVAQKGYDGKRALFEVNNGLGSLIRFDSNNLGNPLVISTVGGSATFQNTNVRFLTDASKKHLMTYEVLNRTGKNTIDISMEFADMRYQSIDDSTGKPVDNLHRDIALVGYTGNLKADNPRGRQYGIYNFNIHGAKEIESDRVDAMEMYAKQFYAYNKFRLAKDAQIVGENEDGSEFLYGPGAFMGAVVKVGDRGPNGKELRIQSDIQQLDNIPMYYYQVGRMVFVSVAIDWSATNAKRPILEDRDGWWRPVMPGGLPSRAWCPVLVGLPLCAETTACNANHVFFDNSIDAYSPFASLAHIRQNEDYILFEFRYDRENNKFTDHTGYKGINKHQSAVFTMVYLTEERSDR
jgi:hypothetical protein